MDLFALKKFVSLFLHPLPVLIGMAVLGLGLYFFGRLEPKPRRRSRDAGWSRDNMDDVEKRRRRRRRWAMAGITATWTSLVLMYLLGLGPVSKMLIRPLEEKFPIFDAQAESVAAHPPKFVVVLGGEYRRANGYPLSSRLGTESTARVLEAVRVQGLLPDSTLIVTAGDRVEGEDKRETAADGMAELARMMGVGERQLLLERDSRDTAEHPLKIQPLIGDVRRVVVVTSAMHMPRAMALFEKQGYDALAAPAGVVPASPGWEFGDFIPSAGSYLRLDAAVHEYLGIAWAKMRGKID